MKNARTAIAASLLVLAACGGSDTAGKGQLSVVLSSSNALAANGRSASAMSTGPGSSSDGTCQGGAQAASVTFSSILARTLDGSLVDVTIPLSEPVDLLSLVNGKQATLPVGFLPPGTYDQLVVVMKSVELTLASGAKIAMTPPGGGWTAIVRVAQPFTVEADTTTTVTFNFRRDLSFGCRGGGWEFHPEFECGGRD